VLVLLGGLGLLSCVCCGGCGALLWYLENPTFESYTDPDGRFSVELPGPPIPQRIVLRDGDPPLKGVEARRETAQETYFVLVGEVPKPPRNDDDVNDFLQKAATDLAAAKVRPGQPTTTRPLLHGNYPAVEVHVQFAPLEPATGLVARVILAENRLYAIGVIGQIIPEQDRVGHFLQSLQIPEPAKKADDAKP
jgi:hypothetical protein